jgi:hypothetical protein
LARADSVDVRARSDSSSHCPKLDGLADAVSGRLVAAAQHTCLALPRPWRPDEYTQENLCLTPSFTQCPCFSVDGAWPTPGRERPFGNTSRASTTRRARASSKPSNGSGARGTKAGTKPSGRAARRKTKARSKTSDRPAAEQAEAALEISRVCEPAGAEVDVKRCVERGRDRALKRIGVSSLGAAGVAIGIWAFLFLTGSADKSETTLESVVAPVFAQSATPWIDYGASRAPELGEVAEAVGSTELQRFLSRSTSAREDRQRDDVLPTPDGAPIVMFSSGAPAADGEQTHLVLEGETLWDVSVEYGVPLEDLAARNELTSDAWIATGDILVIPVVPAP